MCDVCVRGCYCTQNIVTTVWFLAMTITDCRAPRAVPKDQLLTRHINDSTTASALTLSHTDQSITSTREYRGPLELSVNTGSRFASGSGVKRRAETTLGTRNQATTLYINSVMIPSRRPVSWTRASQGSDCRSVSTIPRWLIFV